jgi:two-component system cell cycle response regulator
MSQPESAVLEVLLVEDNAGDEGLVRAALTAFPSEFALTVARRLRDALDLLDRRADRGCVVLLDLHLPDSSGLETLAAMRERHPHVPVVVLTGTTDDAIGIEALREGAQDFLGKDELAARSLARVIRHAAERFRLVGLLERTALLDPLTNVYNRRGFELAVRSRLGSAKRSMQSSTVLFVDLDGLKSINDTYGHECGDAAIRAAATALGETTRTADVLGRIGGDEFAAWLDAAPISAADSFAARANESLKCAARAAEWPFPVSFSVGAAIASPSDPHLDAVLARADSDMYLRRGTRAKSVAV